MYYNSPNLQSIRLNDADLNHSETPCVSNCVNVYESIGCESCYYSLQVPIHEVHKLARVPEALAGDNIKIDRDVYIGNQLWPKVQCFTRVSRNGEKIKFRYSNCWINQNFSTEINAEFVIDIVNAALLKR
jgi:hypothetical protein